MLSSVRNLTRAVRAEPRSIPALRSFVTRASASHPIIRVVTGQNISAKVLADSTTDNGDRLTTFELEYPRFIHSEFMTHRMLSKNAASSRAIPVSKMIEHIGQNTARPSYWGKNQRGMQADLDAEHNELVKLPSSDIPVSREEAWDAARDSAIEYAKAFADAGYHKQITNRILEPYKTMKVVCSGTEYENFFWLRLHKDAQPEIRELADAMNEAMRLSNPMHLIEHEYHLPYITPEVWEMCESYKTYTDPMELALKVSASCCAQVSYRTTDTSIEKAIKIYDLLVKSEPIHASPFEHQARPITDQDIEEFDHAVPTSAITHVDRNGYFWSGNFRGWIQHRHEIPNNTLMR
jgi:thymidylate synthase ThyX